MLKVLFTLYLFALWFWNAWQQASQQSYPLHQMKDPIQVEQDLIG
ncbi:MAG: hypothetical protein NWR72_13975 [Bacteroidia bacterium]|nr:hypothetical protein [Bacteroidia bacterium]